MMNMVQVVNDLLAVAIAVSSYSSGMETHKPTYSIAQEAHLRQSKLRAYCDR
jgi:hypothetical protein